MFSHSESIDEKHKNVSSFCRNVFVPMGVIEIALYSLNAKSSNFYPSLRLRTLLSGVLYRTSYCTHQLQLRPHGSRLSGDRFAVGVHVRVGKLSILKRKNGREGKVEKERSKKTF